MKTVTKIIERTGDRKVVIRKINGKLEGNTKVYHKGYLVIIFHFKNGILTNNSDGWSIDYKHYRISTKDGKLYEMIEGNETHMILEDGTCPEVRTRFTLDLDKFELEEQDYIIYKEGESEYPLFCRSNNIYRNDELDLEFLIDRSLKMVKKGGKLYNIDDASELNYKYDYQEDEDLIIGKPL